MAVALVAVVVAASARAAAVPVLRVSDAALHLATGRWMLATSSIPRSDPFTYTHAGDPWVAQQWLPELLFGTVDRAAGHRGLAILVVVAVGGLATLLAVHAARTSPGFWSVVVVGLALAAGAANWTLRGNLVSFLLLVATWLVVRSDRSVLWLLPLSVVWANSHGLVLVVVALVGLMATVVTAERAMTGRSVLPVGRTWAATGLLAVGTLLTPWGLRLHAYAVEVAMTAPGYVSEWQAPSLARWDVRTLALLAVLTVAALIRDRDRDPVDVAVTLTAIVLGATAIRNITVAALLLALVAIRHPWRPPIDRPRATWGPLDRLLLATTLTAGVAVTVVLVATVGPYRGRYPLDAITTLDGERVWTEDGWSAAVILLRGPDVQVNVDGRVSIHGVDGYREHVQVRGARPGWDAWLDRWCVDDVVVSDDAPLAAALQDRAGWQVVGREPVDTGTAVHLTRTGQCRVSTSPSR